MKWVPKKCIQYEYVQKCLMNCEKTKQFTNNYFYTQMLETKIKDLLQIDDSKSIICVVNGAAALMTIAISIDMEHKKKYWATQSFTFPPSAQGYFSNALIIDIDKEGGLDLNLLPEHINAICVTNVFGNVVDIQKYELWKQKQEGRILIFDNAATPYTFYKNKNSCNYGDASIISFHHTKPLGFGEGGAIICDKKWEHNVRRIINFGIDNQFKLPWLREGNNYKMTEISAIFILQYLLNFDKIIQTHQELYNKVKELNLELYPNFCSGIPVLSCFSIFHDRFTKEFIQKLNDIGIEARKYYTPLESTKISDMFFKRICCFPCHTDLSFEDLKRMKEIIENV